MNTMATQQYRAYRMAATRIGKARTEQFMGRDYLVFPVVMLREAVIWPMNAPKPEFVPATVLAKAPGGWNGRPLVMNHPITEDGPVLANSPEILEKYAYGLVFNAFYEDKKLKSEMWCDEERAKAVGEDAIRTIERLNNEEPVEVSIGALVTTEAEDGEYQGKAYDSKWVDMTPDHLATLSEGTIGACSVEMGCGAPRTAGRHPMADTPVPPEERPKFWDRMLSLGGVMLRLSGSKEYSDVDLRNKLNRAISGAETAFMGIAAVYHESKQVVYETYGEGGFRTYKRGFEVADDGKVTLTEDREEVVPVGGFEAAKAKDQPVGAEIKAACACGGAGHKEMEMTRAQRVAAIIAAKSNSFTEADKPFLDQAPDDLLKRLSEGNSEDKGGAPEPEPGQPKPAADDSEQVPPQQAPTVGHPAPTADAPQKPEPVKDAAAYIATMPEDLQEAMRDALAVRTARRNELMGVIKAAQHNTFTDAQLQAKSTEELNQLASLVGGAPQVAAVDFSGRGMPPAPRAAAESEAIPPAPDVAERIKSLRASKLVN